MSSRSTKRVARQGKDGSKTITYEDKIVNGKVVSSKKVGEVIHVKAVDKVVVVGTRGATRVVANLEGSGAPTSYIKTFHGPATAYTAKAGAKTASGAVARRGLVAVNPKQIPYGSKLYIVADDGMALRTAADTADSSRTVPAPWSTSIWTATANAPSGANATSPSMSSAGATDASDK